MIDVPKLQILKYSNGEGILWLNYFSSITGLLLYLIRPVIIFIYIFMH